MNDWLTALQNLIKKAWKLCDVLSFVLQNICVNIHLRKIISHFINNKLQLSIHLSNYNSVRTIFFSESEKEISWKKCSTQACMYKLHQLCATFMWRRIHNSPFKSVNIKVYEMHWKIGVSASENAAWIFTIKQLETIQISFGRTVQFFFVYMAPIERKPEKSVKSALTKRF